MKASARDERAVLHVIELCTALEEKALAIYEEILARTDDTRLRLLWETLVSDERDHREYWLRLKEVCTAGGIPEVFEEPRKYVDELVALHGRLDHLAAKAREEFSPPEVFVHVLRLEFLLLHPSFATLFHYLPDSSVTNSPSRTYEQHLGRLFTAIMDYKELTPELELLCATIGQVWKKGEEVASRAVTDMLTGLLSRRGLYIAMKPVAYLAKREEKTAGAMILEISNLQDINRAAGHTGGDEVLAATARIISRRLRGSDAIGRFGGDDFLAVLTRFEPEALAMIGGEIIEGAAQVERGGVPVSLSVGISHTVMKGDVEETLEALIRSADEALAAARGTGTCVIRALA